MKKNSEYPLGSEIDISQTKNGHPDLIYRSLTLCIPKTLKRILKHTVKTLMKGLLCLLRLN